MRILMWDQVRKELEGSAAFNVALLRAIDPRIISHRPRDPEKTRLMAELGMETSIDGVDFQGESGVKKNSRRCIVEAYPKPSKVQIDLELECDLDDD